MELDLGPVATAQVMQQDALFLVNEGATPARLAYALGLMLQHQEALHPEASTSAPIRLLLDALNQAAQPALPLCEAVTF